MSNETIMSNDYVRTYEAPQISTTLVTSPRFGHTNDITALFSNNTNDQEDYRAGLIAAASITTICFFCFIIIIPILMCCGKQRVGFLSGSPLTANSSSTTANTKTTVVDGAPRRDCCVRFTSPTFVRSMFILSGIIFILFGILIVTEGVTNLQDTIVNVHQSAIDIDSIATEADDIMNSGLKDIQSTASSVRDGIVAQLSGDTFCPADPTLENNNELALNIRTKADEASNLLLLLDDFLSDSITTISSAIIQVQKGAQQVERATDDVDLTDWEALLVLIPYTIVPCLLVAAAIMAQYDVEFPILLTTINWCLMPLFVIMVIVCAGVASGMIAAASANSDFCLPGGRPEIDSYTGTSPDTTVYRILDRKQYDNTMLVRQVASYYIDQCQTTNDPFLFAKNYIPTLMDSQESLNDLLQTINNGDALTQLSLYCNREYTDIDTLIEQMNSIIDVLLDALQRTIELVSCDRIVPIYHRAMYDASCQYSVSAMFWIFSASLIMGTFGLLMILFRAAYKPTVYEDEDSTYGMNNTARNSNDEQQPNYEPDLVIYDDGNVAPQYSPRKVASSAYSYTPPRGQGANAPRNSTFLNTSNQYSPNKSSIYMDDSPGRNASYY